MTISIDYHGTYLEHPAFFDAMANSMQMAGHRVGIITGVREKEYDENNRLVSRREEILRHLGFVPDFLHLWGENETIANGNIWKIHRMIEEDVEVHFDDDAREMKKLTTRQVIKTMCVGEQEKF